MVEAFGGECAECGYDRCHDGLEFHHTDPTAKEFAFGAIRANPTSWDRIVEELRKCVMLCCRCHREAHAGLLPIDDPIWSRFDEAYVNYREIEDESDPCPVCDGKKLKRNRTCSRACAATLTGKIDWNNIDLSKLISLHSTNTAIAEQIGCSDVAVAKRRKKVGL